MSTTYRKKKKETVYMSKAELVKPSTVKEILALFDVTYKTWRAWIKPHLEEIGTLKARVYTPLQMEIIFKLLGYPSHIILTDEDDDSKDQAA